MYLFQLLDSGVVPVALPLSTPNNRTHPTPDRNVIQMAEGSWGYLLSLSFVCIFPDTKYYIFSDLDLRTKGSKIKMHFDQSKDQHL